MERGVAFAEPRIDSWFRGVVYERDPCGWGEP